MSFETGVSLIFVAGYGYVARRTYDTYRTIQRGKSRRMSVVSPLKKRKVEHGMVRGTTQAPSMVPSFQTATRATRYRQNLGRRPGKYATRRVTHEGNNTSPSDKRLHHHRIIRIPWSDNESIINRRRSQLAHVKGIKLRAIFELTSLLNGNAGDEAWLAPIQIRWAVLNPKTDSGDPLTSTPASFFIQNMPEASNTTDMAPDWPTEGKVWAYMNRKINRESYGVVKEGQFVLSFPSDSGQTAAGALRKTRDCYKHLNMYIPINRQMKFENNDTVANSELPQENLHFVWWYTRYGDTSDNQKYTTLPHPVLMHYEATSYFTNSAMYR